VLRIGVLIACISYYAMGGVVWDEQGGVMVLIERG
jgi:hypothetical protein